VVAAGLLVCGFGAVCVRARRRSVQPEEQQSTSSTNAGQWPRPRHYLLLTLFFSAVAVYGSLVPFDFGLLGFGEAMGQMAEILREPVSPHSRSNFVANVLLFVPISYCLLAVFTATRRNHMRTIVCVPLVGLLCAALSVAVEFGQLWLPERVASLSDIVAQIIGATAGMGLWLMVGRTVDDWVRSYTLSERPKQQIHWLLEAYLLGLAIYSLLPLDLISRPAELVHKYRDGKILLVPFSNAGWDFATFYALFRDMALFIPVGMLAATWMTSDRRQVRPLATSVLLGGSAVLTLEVAKLFVYSRSTASGTLICGMVGVCVGAWAMRRWRRGR
jgi:VanZ family protein